MSSFDESQWFQVNYQYQSNVLKEIYKNYPKYVTKSKKPGIVNKNKAFAEKMTEKLDEILTKISS